MTKQFEACHKHAFSTEPSQFFVLNRDLSAFFFCTEYLEDTHENPCTKICEDAVECKGELCM